MLLRILLVFVVSIFNRAKADPDLLPVEFNYFNHLDPKKDSIDDKVLLKYIENVKAAESTYAKSDNPQMLSRVELIYSELTGVYATEHQVFHGIEYGKISYEKIAKALDLAPEDREIIEVYADTVAGLAGHGDFIKGKIEKGYGGIKIDELVKTAVRALLREKNPGNPVVDPNDQVAIANLKRQQELWQQSRGMLKKLDPDGKIAASLSNSPAAAPTAGAQ